MVACKCNNEDQVFIYDLLNNKVMFKIPVLALIWRSIEGALNFFKWKMLINLLIIVRLTNFIKEITKIIRKTARNIQTILFKLNIKKN